LRGGKLRDVEKVLKVVARLLVQRRWGWRRCRRLTATTSQPTKVNFVVSRVIDNLDDLCAKFINGKLLKLIEWLPYLGNGDLGNNRLLRHGTISLAV
jgi:hypothetical protein